MIWKKYSIDSKKIYLWQLGFVQFWVKKNGKVWDIAHAVSKIPFDDFIVAKEVAEPENVSRKSFIADAANTLNIVPALPDKPLIIKPLNNLTMLPAVGKQLYVHIPVWIQLYTGAVKKENILYEFCTQELSNSWFGDPDNGTLAYALPDNLYVDIETVESAQNSAICPIRITNISQQQLAFQRLLVEVDLLGIYSSDNKLYTNELKVKFKGESTASDTNYGQQAPSFLTGVKHLSSPRNLTKNSVLKKSFYFLKSLTDY